jgi:hypothetical protein
MSQPIVRSKARLRSVVQGQSAAMRRVVGAGGAAQLRGDVQQPVAKLLRLGSSEWPVEE